jgi:hypothetical protein
MLVRKFAGGKMRGSKVDQLTNIGSTQVTVYVNQARKGYKG